MKTFFLELKTYFIKTSSNRSSNLKKEKKRIQILRTRIEILEKENFFFEKMFYNIGSSDFPFHSFSWICLEEFIPSPTPPTAF